MLYDYVTAKERLKRLQPIQKCGWCALFSRFKKNKRNQSAKKLEPDNNHQQKPSCNNKKKVRASVLRCDAGQSFWINDDIQIVVLSSCKSVTHIGIEAPPDTRIVKAKLHDKKQSHEDD